VNEPVCRRFLVSGRVQGVCFRISVLQFVQQKTPDLLGHVKNLPDGRVEVEAVGDPRDLQALEDYCQHGPSAARVERVEVNEWGGDGREIRNALPGLPYQTYLKGAQEPPIKWITYAGIRHFLKTIIYIKLNYALAILK